MIRPHPQLDPNKTYMFIIRPGHLRGMKEMTPAEAEAYFRRNMTESERLADLVERVEHIERILGVKI